MLIYIMRNTLAIWQGMYQESLRLNVKIEIRVYTYVCIALQFLLLKIINVQFVHTFVRDENFAQYSYNFLRKFFRISNKPRDK